MLTFLHGKISTRLQAVAVPDAPFLGGGASPLAAGAQMDRSPNFSGADRPRAWPVRLYRIDLPH